jgi:hypothetical protein
LQKSTHFNPRGETHEKGLPEDANAKASKDFMSFGGCYFSQIRLVP